MKKYIYPLAIAATALLSTACSDEMVNDGPQIPEDQKEKISFSLSDEANSTRAGFGGSATFLAMRMQSNEKGGTGVKYTRTSATAEKDNTLSAVSYSNVVFTVDQTRYWDDAHGRKSLLSVFAVAIPNYATDGKGLLEKLDKGDASLTWGNSGENKIVWSISTTAQSKDVVSENSAAVTSESGTIDQEDLVYSHNIQAGGKDGIYRWDYSAGTHKPDKTGATTHEDGQMLFFQNGVDLSATPTDAPGHFDKGHLVFKHSLSRITITLVEGEGYDKTSANKDADFKFKEGTNITLLHMNIKGTLDLPTGKWTITAKTDGGIGNITKIAQTATGTLAADHATEAYRNSKYYTLTAQMLPDYVIADGSNTNVMKFEIDGNEYFITQNMLFDALAAEAGNKIADYGYDTENNNKFTMQQGKNYNFTIKVDKTKIDQVTATLVPWVKVTAKDFGLDNSHVEFTFLSPTGEACPLDNINFFQKTEDLGNIYTDNSYITDNKGVKFSGNYLAKSNTTPATLTAMPDTDPVKYSTNWYFEDNKTAYHFRTVSDNAVTTLSNGSGSNTYFVMTGAAGATLPDYHWGAPMKTGTNLAYNTAADKGYVANVHEGITATNSDLKITEMHMLSNIFITLETSTDDDKVALNGATIKLTKLSNEGTVDMGTGYITPGKTVSTAFTANQYVEEVTMQAPSDYWQTENVKTKAFQYAVIPQALVRSTGESDDDYIGITITTSDNNQYYVIRKLSEIYATSTTQGGSAYSDPDQTIASGATPTDAEKEAARIKRWYPNHSYHYNIKITKNKIDNITCTVAKWVDVIAADTKIDLED